MHPVKVDQATPILPRGVPDLPHPLSEAAGRPTRNTCNERPNVVQYTVKPLGTWLEPATERRRGSHVFRAEWLDTLDLLERELAHLGATGVVVQVDVLDAQIRRDGMLRAGARVGFPGVRLSFASAHGPLTYATDAYETHFHWASHSGWQANLRAIALTLGALRDIDRWGVSRRGEQYAGWTALTARPAEFTPDQAAEFIAHWSGLTVTAQAILRDPNTRRTAYRAAARRAHPDAGGDTDTMTRLNAARDLLDSR